MDIQRRNRSGPPKIESFRNAPPPVGAPSEGTAWGVWTLIEPHLVPVPVKASDAVVGRPRRIDDIASTVLQYASTGAERTAITSTGMQALAVAVDVMICAGRDGKAAYINSVYQALAQRWSPLFRGTNGAGVWAKTPETLTRARTQMLDSGVNLTRVWTAVCDGVAGLYTVSTIGGADHARGRSVILVKGELLAQFESIIRKDREYRHAPARNRVLRADAPMPKRRIGKEIIGEREYDVMHVGAPTEKVLDVLERARLFVNVGEVRRSVDALTSALRVHPWPKMLAQWKMGNALPKQATAGQKKAYQLAEKTFVKANRTAQKEYASLVGRRAQADAVFQQADAVKDDRGLLEIKTGYSKTRNRRFQARHFWPAEVTVKRDNVTVELPPEETTAYTLYGMEGPFTAKASPRGLWFYARAVFDADSVKQWFNENTGEPWHDDFDGPVRPLVGVDAASSMYQIVSVVLGWRDAEVFLRDNDMKTAIMAALREVDRRGLLRGMTDEQARNSAGVVVNAGYGQSDMSILKRLKSDAVAFSTDWRDVTEPNLKQLLADAAAISRAVAIVLAMRHEYLTVAQALAAAARERDPYAGVQLFDPYDGQPYTLNRPLAETKVLPNEGTPLMTVVPVGQPNANGDYMPNWYGRVVPVRRRDKNGKWTDALKKDGTARMRRVDTKGSIYTSLAPTLVHALDAAYAAHVVMCLRKVDIRDMVLINDCFLVPSDAYPLLINALEDAARSWFEGLEPFYKTFDQYLGDHPVHGPTVARWRKSWEARLSAVKAGERDADWPDFRFKTETTVVLALG
jgi:hypothetical protein